MIFTLCIFGFMHLTKALMSKDTERLDEPELMSLVFGEADLYTIHQALMLAVSPSISALRLVRIGVTVKARFQFHKKCNHE